MRSLVRPGVVAVAVVLVMALIVGGCAPKVAPPPAAEVKKPECINMVFDGDISGPYAAVAAPLVSALEASTEYINTKLGGVYGVPWRTTLYDSAGKVEVVVSNFMKIREMSPKPILVMCATSSEGEALLPLTREAEIPCGVPASTACLYPVGYNFGWIPLYPDAFGYFIDWLVRNWKGDKPPKLAFLNWDTTFGRAVETKECYAYAADKKVDIVATERFGLRDVDLTTQLTKINAQRADWIWSNSATIGAFVVMKTMKEMGLNIPVCFPSGVSVDPAVVKMGPTVFEGCYQPSSIWSADDWTHPGVRLARDYFERQGKPEAQWGGATLVTWSMQLVYYEAAKRVVDKYGWENLDGKHVKEALENFRDFPVLSGASVITYTPKRHSPSKATMQMVKGGKVIQLQVEWGDMPDLKPPEYK